MCQNVKKYAKENDQLCLIIIFEQIIIFRSNEVQEICPW